MRSIMKKNRFRLVFLFAMISVVMAKTPALHPEFALLDEDGQNVLVSGKPLSTMQSCGFCHDTEYIATHSRHSDAGLSSMKGYSPGAEDYPWDRSTGYFGKWNPLNYRYLSGSQDSLTDLSRAEWIKIQGFRHIGGGPAEFDMHGERLDKKPSSSDWDWKKSGVVEMNCFLCHTRQPDNASRSRALEKGAFGWANSATLMETGVISLQNETYKWNSTAFNERGEVKREFLTPIDPTNNNCGQCHGLVFTATDMPDGLKSCDWNTATRGEIIAPQRINRTGLNLLNKHELNRSWDIHAERAVECVDCHPSANNPIYYQDEKDHQLAHLKFDARRVDVVDFLYRPSHEFARGGFSVTSDQRAQGETMRSCDACHDAHAVHNWLPYEDAHFQAVSCESCHIPRMHGPAYEQVDWTVLTLEKAGLHDCRGAEGDPRDITTTIEGFEPILLPTKSSDDQIKLRPYNLISAWYWVYGVEPKPVRKADLETAFFENDQYRQDILQVFDTDGDGQLSELELRLDTPEKSQKVQRNLEDLGLTHLQIQADVQAFKINHDVTNGKWATRECGTCHSKDSRIGAEFELTTYTPGGVLPELAGNLPLDQMGSMVSDDQGRLFYALDVSGNSLYIFGLNPVKWVDWLGLLLFLGTMAGVVVHATYRVIFSRRNAPKAHKTKPVYMYRFYERLWHWVQVLAIFLLLLTGIIIHKPEMLGIMFFPYVVQVHNALGFILLANAFLSVFYHLVSGEIKQYILQPKGFFDQAVAQAGYYLKGIFRGDDHPFEKSREKKLNPLQQMTYFGLLNFLLPVQIITGLLIWSVQTWPVISTALGGLSVLGPIHTLLAWLFATFILLHVYLTTTGHRPLDGIRAMINGWDDINDHSHGKSSGNETELEEKIK